MAGNFLGDYLNNQQVAALPDAVQEGVRLHRQIDSFTDQHPLVRKGVRRMYGRHSKYATVLIDIFYDYLLTVNWAGFAAEPLPDFAQRAYRALEKHLHLMPEPVRSYVPQMIADDWLQKYGTYDGIAYTLKRMGGRMSRPELMDGALDTLRQQLPELNQEFQVFFPQVMDFVGLPKP